MTSKITGRRSASVKSIMQVKDITPKLAREIREVWRTVKSRNNAREQIDKLIDTCGVEYMGIHKRTRQHVYYCNAGDSYAATVIFNGLNLTVNCWGDLVERNLIRESETN